MKLYEVNDKIEEAFINATDPETGEIDMDHVVDALADLDLLREVKILNTAAYILGLRAEADAVHAIGESIERQADQHYRRATVLSNQADRLQKYLEQNVTPGEKFSDERARISWRKSERVEILGEVEELPMGFVKTISLPRKNEIKRAIKDGESVHGARLVEHQNIQIKP